MLQQAVAAAGAARRRSASGGAFASRLERHPTLPPTAENVHAHLRIQKRTAQQGTFTAAYHFIRYGLSVLRN